MKLWTCYACLYERIYNPNEMLEQQGSLRSCLRIRPAVMQKEKEVEAYDCISTVTIVA
jgi:hypothetical protein